MTAHQAEIIKLHSTKAPFGVFGGLIGVVSLAAVVHILGFESALVDEAADQRNIILDIGVGLGYVFAAIFGALSITAEFRFGTIRPTLLKQPNRSLHLSAKAPIQLVAGAVIGCSATAYAIALSAAFLNFRGLHLELDAGDVARLMGGGAFGGAAFAILGLSLGTILRSQVPTTVGFLVWMLFLENLLRPGVPSVAKFAPVTLGRTVAGSTSESLLSPLNAALILSGLCVLALASARRSLGHSDIT